MRNRSQSTTPNQRNIVHTYDVSVSKRQDRHGDCKTLPASAAVARYTCDKKSRTTWSTLAALQTVVSLHVATGTVSCTMRCQASFTRSNRERAVQSELKPLPRCMQAGSLQLLLTGEYRSLQLRSFYDESLPAKDCALSHRKGLRIVSTLSLE